MTYQDARIGERSATERRVLVLPTTGADALAIGKVFAANQIDFDICTSMKQLCTMHGAGAGGLIISEDTLLADPTELLTCIAAQPVWSDLPIIVLSRAGRESGALANLIGKLGNVSVIERPIRTSTLVSVVRSLLRARDRQYQVREHLAQQEQAQKRIREGAIEREQLLESERAARGEAERASRTKDEFLATLSHELRTPLTAILGWTQVLRKIGGMPEDAANALTVIERNARSQAQIIADLLDMSSIISGKVRLDVQRTDLAPVIAATVETVRPAALAKNIRLHVVLDPMAGPVRGDPGRLQQVFWNLLTNAVKFTPKEGRVAITLARVNSHLEIEVADNGDGIDPSFLPHMFDRFRQADSSTTRTHGGLGLGLSIVKQLVELHGGFISVRSAGRGQGSTFRITLPLMATADESVEPSDMREHPAHSAGVPDIATLATSDLTGVRVLVVDDEVDARSLVKRLLQDCNAVVSTAASAAEALQAVGRDDLDVIVSDIGMPEEDGFSLIRRVRAMNGKSAATPAIALTAYARIEDRVKAIQAGFQSHLSKPVEPVELVTMVESLAHRRG
jgi:signal transduction histidine kinase/CheY-like chemotaxis protein